MKPAALAAVFLGLSLLSFFSFPGHTWLQQDSQIYTPILEHLADPSVLSNDIVVARPHVAFTIYDEIALGLHAVTQGSFETILGSLDILFRALGLWGIYLIAAALGLSAVPAVIVALIWSLGATIIGPAVLTVEYEPVPRGFAVPLLMLAVGLAAHRKWLWSGVAAGVAFLIHAPAAYPFWIIYPVALWQAPRGLPFKRSPRVSIAALVASLFLLLLSAHLQRGVTEPQHFFERLTPRIEQLQQMRASYNWISIWWRDYAGQYCFFFAVCVAATWRLRPVMRPSMLPWLLGLPAIGIVSMPISWVLLEWGKWALLPQLQPMRALLFVTAFAVLLCAVAGCHAARAKRSGEAFCWFVLPWLIPMQVRLQSPPSTAVVAVCVLYALLSLAAFSAPSRLAAIACLSLLTCYWTIPHAARVVNYPALHTRELAALSQWARTSTPKTGVFLFADEGRQNTPGIFRSEALRPVYVDWKGGGQVNYLPEFAVEWWKRWQDTMAQPFEPERLPHFADVGIDYVVLNVNRLKTNPVAPGHSPVFQNSKYAVYRTK